MLFRSGAYLRPPLAKISSCRVHNYKRNSQRFCTPGAPATRLAVFCRSSQLRCEAIPEREPIEGCQRPTPNLAAFDASIDPTTARCGIPPGPHEEFASAKPRAAHFITCKIGSNIQRKLPDSWAARIPTVGTTYVKNEPMKPESSENLPATP